MLIDYCAVGLQRRFCAPYTGLNQAVTLVGLSVTCLCCERLEIHVDKSWLRHSLEADAEPN